MSVVSYNTKYWTVQIINLDGYQKNYNFDNLTKALNLFKTESQNLHDTLILKECIFYKPLWSIEQRSGVSWNKKTDLYLNIIKKDTYLDEAIKYLAENHFRIK